MAAARNGERGSPFQLSIRINRRQAEDGSGNIDG
jgi:hypothetical protein